MIEDFGYAKRVWRTKVLAQAASIEVQTMLQAFLPEGFTVKIERREAEVPGFPFSPKYQFCATFGDPNPKGSDAHLFVQGYTEDDVRCRLLGLILSRRGFFPMT